MEADVLIRELEPVTMPEEKIDKKVGMGEVGKT
jgi:hypothetical protein